MLDLHSSVNNTSTTETGLRLELVITPPPPPSNVPKGTPDGPGISKQVSTCGASTTEGKGGGGRGTAYTEWYIQG